MLDITTIILTYNEEIHIRRCLENVCRFSKKVIVVDSPSTDRTRKIVEEFHLSNPLNSSTDIEFVVHKYPGNQAEQFNWALDNCKIETEWILRLDADEYLTPELIEELEEKLPKLPKEVTACVLPLGRAFMGRVLKHGIVNGIKMIRLFRKGKARYEVRMMDECLKTIEGETVTMQNKFVDDSRISISQFISKHNNYSSREAFVLLDAEYGLSEQQDEMAFAKETADKRAQKAKYARMPLFVRALAYFIYRYIVKLGFLDGKEGFCWDFFQGLWYRMLVDAKVYEAKRHCGGDKAKLIDYIQRNWGIKITQDQK